MSPDSSDDLNRARRNRLTLIVLVMLVLAIASLSYFCREALYPVFFKM